MNYEGLVEIIEREEEALQKVLNLLDEQYKFIMKKEVFELEALVDRMKDVNVELASKEMDRRKYIGNSNMKDIVNNSNYPRLDQAFRRVNKLLHSVKLQKDTNDLLLKQQISYNNQLLNVINPRREVKTYNSYGNLSK